MTRMTTQQRLGCLLKHLASLAERHGDEIVISSLNPQALFNECGFTDSDEIAFYIERPRRRGLVDLPRDGYNKLSVYVTIEGYCHLDDLT